MTKPSVPEPPPTAGVSEVVPALLAYLKSAGNPQELIDLIQARDAFGREKYGQTLMTHDGRNAVEDLDQEVGDSFVYAFKIRMEKGFSPEVKARLLEHLEDLIMLIKAS